MTPLNEDLVIIRTGSTSQTASPDGVNTDILSPSEKSTHANRSENALLTHFRTAVAEDLRDLAYLQDREMTKEVIEALKQVEFPDNLGLRLQTPAGQEACRWLKQAISEWPETIEPALIDELASFCLYLSEQHLSYLPL